MEWKQIETDWSKMKSDVQAKWSKLSDDDFTKVGGKRDSLIGKVRHHYNLSKENAEKQVSSWSSTVRSQSTK